MTHGKRNTANRKKNVYIYIIYVFADRLEGMSYIRTKLLYFTGIKLILSEVDFENCPLNTAFNP